MKRRSCGLVQRIGTVDSATPQPDPGGGQAPALHFLIPPSAIGLQLGTFRPWRAGIEVDWRTHPGSESRTCFHSNRSCRLVPARQGLKSRSCGLVQRIGTADSATPHPDPSGGQAPALHSPLPSPPLDSGFRRSDESGVCFHSNDELRGRNENDENAEWRGSLAHSKAV